MTAEQLFGMQTARICHILVELYMMKKKEEGGRRTKSKYSSLIFSTVKRINGTLGVYLTLEYLRVLIYKRFVSLCCVFLKAASIP